MLEIILDKAIDDGPATKLGPFGEVQASHRRVKAGEYEIARSYDGSWHHGGRRFLQVSVAPWGVDGQIELDFVGPWGRTSPSHRARVMRFFGERLLAGSDWVATDDDDGRCWLAEETAFANDGLRLRAA